MHALIEKLNELVEAGVELAHAADLDLPRLQAWVDQRARCCAALAEARNGADGNGAAIAQLAVELRALDDTIAGRIQSHMSQLRGEIETVGKLKNFVSSPAGVGRSLGMQRSA